MDKYAVIVAGGAGTRMGSSLPKQFLSLRGRSILWYTLSAFLEAYHNIQIILVLPEFYLEKGQSIANSMPRSENIILTRGGSTRFESVKNGLAHVPDDALVFVHDGVRCLVTPRLIKRCYDAAIEKGNAIPAVSPVDTVRIETPKGNEMMDRVQVKLIQTPQTFFAGILKKAFRQPYRDSFTDEASVLESFGENIHLVEGEITNLKITTQLDLLVADKILEKRDEFPEKCENL